MAEPIRTRSVICETAHANANGEALTQYSPGTSGACGKDEK